ncbi:MAG: hotdog fold thioesterase [Endozoicomonadaceae bacterium]|nr:hotdog fold thioesterase [Endozoicomonadaceae bacterium]
MTTIWRRKVTIENLHHITKKTMCEHLGIKFTQIGDNYIEGTMPVDHRTRQTMNILHGGASLAFAETLGSLAGNLCVDDPAYCVGLEINANHVASVSSGWVTGKAAPLHLGKKTHVWSIHIHSEDNRLLCVSRHTLMVMR